MLAIASSHHYCILISYHSRRRYRPHHDWPLSGRGLLSGALSLLGCGVHHQRVGEGRHLASDRLLTPLIERMLRRHTTLDLRDYADLLQLWKDYRVVEIKVEPDSWLASTRLGDLDLMAEGITVLGIVRHNGSYVGAPSVESRLHPGDLIILYGRAHRLHDLATRSAGAIQAHEDAKAEHRRNSVTEPDRN